MITAITRQWKPLCLLGLALTGMTACDSKGKPGITVGGAPALAPDPAEVVKVLETAQAEIKRQPSGNIIQVAFRKSPMTDAEAGLLKDLPGLQTLVVTSTDMTMAGWQEIGKLSKLRTLDVRDCKLNDAQFKAAVSGLTELVAIRMSGKSGATTVSDDSIGALKNCPQAASARRRLPVYQ